MGLMREIAEANGIDVVLAGRQELIRARDAVRFVDACLARWIRIVGIEGFVRSEASLVPDPALIADFSGLTDTSKSNEAARRFLASSKIEGDVGFEFVVISGKARN
jgi:hypothetical protein